MHCERCKKEFPEEDLKAPPKILWLLTLPLYFLGPAAAKDGKAKYCSYCRRRVIFAMVIVALFIGAIIYFKIFVPPSTGNG